MVKTPALAFQTPDHATGHAGSKVGFSESNTVFGFGSLWGFGLAVWLCRCRWFRASEGLRKFATSHPNPKALSLHFTAQTAEAMFRMDSSGSEEAEVAHPDYDHSEASGSSHRS